MKKNILAVTGVYIATVIGAGFASGQEILSFFARYGAKSIISVIAAGAFFGLFAFLILNRVRMDKMDTFDAYLQKIMGRRCAGIVDKVIVCFMLVVFCVMAAGSGASIAQLLGVSEKLGAFLMCGACFVVFAFNLKGVMAVNSFLAPVIILGTVVICFYILRFRETAVFANGVRGLWDNWVVAGASYVSYNILTAAVILVGMRRFVSSRADAAKIGVLSGACLGCIMLLIWVVIKIYYGKIDLGEVPMLTLVLRQGRGLAVAYTIVLFLAMLTTAVSNGYGIVMRLVHLDRRFAALLVCMTGFAGAAVGFSTLVEKLYRLCGYIGFVLIACVLWDGVRQVCNVKKNRKNIRYQKKNANKPIKIGYNNR